MTWTISKRGKSGEISLKSTEQLSMMLVEWGGIVGMYSSGAKSRQKAQIHPMETTKNCTSSSWNLFPGK